MGKRCKCRVSPLRFGCACVAVGRSVTPVSHRVRPMTLTSKRSVKLPEYKFSQLGSFRPVAGRWSTTRLMGG